MQGKKLIIILSGVVVIAAALAAAFLFGPLKGLISSGSETKSGRGNISGNDLVVQDGEWIYYINKNGDWDIYKIHTDGTQNEKILENNDRSQYGGRCLQIWDGWLYYISHSEDCIYRVRLDGTGKKNISDGYYSKFSIVDGYVYAISEGYVLYQMKTDGTNEKIMIDDNVSAYCVSDGWIYYANEVMSMGYYPDNYEKGIYKVKLDGSQKEKICDDYTMAPISVIDGWIYYINDFDEYKLYRIKTDGSERTKLVDEKLWSNIVVGDWMYYTLVPSDNNGIFRIRLDGSEQTKICDEPEASYINYAGGWFYYLKEVGDEFFSTDNNLYRVRIDGADKQQVTF